MKKEAIFYTDWLVLPKNDFRILIMLAEYGGKFSGTLSDICVYFDVSAQARNRNKFRESIAGLKERQFITASEDVRCLHISTNPKAEENKIVIQKEWVKRVRQHEPWKRSVSWIQVIKVFLWIWKYGSTESFCTRQMIAGCLGDASAETVGEAIMVLDHHYGAILRKRVSEKVDDEHFITLGQMIQASAFW